MEKKTDILSFIIKNVFVCFLVIFLGIYISLCNGNSNYMTHKKTELTSEAIQRFEEDVKNGKNINLEDYIDINDNVPSNKVSKLGIYLSDKVTVFSKGIIKTIGKIFGSIFTE